MSYTGLVYKVWGKYKKCVAWDLFNVVCLSVKNNGRERKRDWELQRDRKRDKKGERKKETLVTMMYFCFGWCQGLFCFKGQLMQAHYHRTNSNYLVLCSKMSLWVSCKVCGLLENNNFKMSLRCLEIHWFGLRLVWMMIHPFLLNLIMHCAVEIPWLNGSQVSQFDCWNKYLLKQVPLFQMNMLIYGPQSVILRKVGVFLVQMNECIIAY